MMKLAGRGMAVVGSLWTLLIGSAVAIGQGMKNPELAYISYDGHSTAIYTLDLYAGVAAILRGTENVIFFAWSPDGQALAFVTQHADENTPLYVVSAQGRDKRQMAQMTYSGKSPWSPDSRRLVFTRNAAGQDDLYVMDVQASQPQSLLHNSSRQVNPLWSSDGQYIAFLSLDGTLIDLNIISLDGTFRRMLTGLVSTDFIWSPQGHSLAFVKEDGIYIFNAAQDSSVGLPEAPTPDSALSWSPDGKRLAFIAKDDRQRRSISIVDIDSSRVQRLLENLPAELAGRVNWSADGQHITFSAYFPPDTNTEIYMTSLNGEVRRVTFNDRVDWLPSWRP